MVSKGIGVQKFIFVRKGTKKKSYLQIFLKKNGYRVSGIGYQVSGRWVLNGDFEQEP
jgi:hypothetical protein